MSEMKWTESQLQAITAYNCDLLVSASAGSGKTAVLVERIRRHITQQGTPILNMLVVTFTNAAAAQLKEKLAKSLNSAIAEEPRNKFLRRQRRDLPRASICTIDSFCLELVRRHFSVLGLSAGVRIADESENRLLMSDIMEQCLELFYDRGNELGISDFAGFCNNFSMLRDEALGDIFLNIYYKMYSQIKGIDGIRESAELLKKSDGEPFDNIWGKQIKNRTLSFMKSAASMYEDILAEIGSYASVEKAYGNAFNDDLRIIHDVIGACEIGYEAVRGILTNVKYVRLGSLRDKSYADEAEVLKAKRQFFKDMVEKLSELYYTDAGSNREICGKIVELNFDLHTFLSYFHTRLMTEKNKRGIVSFADCEALTLKLLCEDGQPTPIALEYREKYNEIYVDEYQDVNSVQDCIFRMVSSPNSRFMVGDIKQSIYGFRGAEPTLFGDYRDSFDHYTDGLDSSPHYCKIFLSENFRSSENIIKTANLVGRSCFEKGESNIGYCDEDALNFSKTGIDAYDHYPVNIAVVTGNEEKNAEAVYVCNEIEKLISEGIAPSDIAILLRSLTSSALDFTSELDKRGIPYYCDVKKEFFDNPEIMLALCWLNTIDNRRRDIFVCGILKSPIYNFSLDELMRIRKTCPGETLYESVAEYTEEYNFDKGRRFIEDISELRAFSKANTADEVIWRLMYEKGLMSIVMNDKSPADAKVARNNLLLFYDYARKFENGEFKGVYNFLVYIEKVIEAGQALPSAAAFAGSGNTVKIMTVHHSKGLEFPFCFVSATHKPISKKDLQGKLLFHPELGIAAKIADESGLALYDSYIMSALRCRIEEDNLDEEFRVLYVALTRGVSRMWITCTAKDGEMFIQANSAPEYMSTRPYMSVNGCYIKWILPAVRGKCADVLSVDASEKACDNKMLIEDSCVGTIPDIKELKEHISFTYPHANAVDIPAKIAVSRLYPDILDTTDGVDLTTIIKPKRPFFAEAALTNRGVDIGNATHTFMQFCDFDKVEKNGVASELERLKKEKFLSYDAADMVDVCAVQKFFTSELYSVIRSSQHVYREKRFNIDLPASTFTVEHKAQLQDETVLVQGVIDCFVYDDDGGIILIDYKTDRVPAGDIGREILRERHSRQLGYYKKALEVITGDKVKQSLIYSFSLNEAIEI